MKKTLLILGCLLAVSSYSQTNRYTTVSTSSYVPKSDQDIYNDMLVKQKNLNKNIFSLLDICENQLNNQEFCYGDYRSTVFSIKNRLNDVNKKAMNGFISIYDVENIYNNCVRDYNKALKKHNKLIEKYYEKPLASKTTKKSKSLKLSKDISQLERKISKNLKDKSIYNQEFIAIMRDLSEEISSLKKYDLSDEYDLYTAIDLYNEIEKKYSTVITNNINIKK